MDEHADRNADFYDRLGKGEVQREDFERYIYGGSQNLQQHEDGRDRIEDQDKKAMLKVARGAHP